MSYKLYNPITGITLSPADKSCLRGDKRNLGN
jgi:hypothetical protein